MGHFFGLLGSCSGAWNCWENTGGIVDSLKLIGFKKAHDTTALLLEEQTQKCGLMVSRFTCEDLTIFLSLCLSLSPTLLAVTNHRQKQFEAVFYGRGECWTTLCHVHLENLFAPKRNTRLGCHHNLSSTPPILPTALIPGGTRERKKTQTTTSLHQWSVSLANGGIVEVAVTSASAGKSPSSGLWLVRATPFFPNFLFAVTRTSPDQPPCRRFASRWRPQRQRTSPGCLTRPPTSAPARRPTFASAQGRASVGATRWARGLEAGRPHPSEEREGTRRRITAA